MAEAIEDKKKPPEGRLALLEGLLIQAALVLDGKCRPNQEEAEQCWRVLDFGVKENRKFAGVLLGFVTWWGTKEDLCRLRDVLARGATAQLRASLEQAIGALETKVERDAG